MTIPLAVGFQVAKLVLRPVWERYMSWKTSANIGARDEIPYAKQKATEGKAKQVRR